MLLKTFSRSRKPKPHQCRNVTARRRSLLLESLEDRRLLAAVAVFDNGSFVDTGGGSWSESDNLQASLSSLGHTVTPFTGTSAAGINAALSGQDVLVIPELEVGDLNAALSPAARTQISDFVSSGGGFVIHGDASGNDDEDLINAVFGFNVAPGLNAATGTSSITGQAVGTAFAGGPGTIPNNNGTYMWTTSSLPASAQSVYATGTNTTVALVPFGSGTIAFLAYDWFDAEPVGSQDGGWLQVLDSAVEEVSASTTATADANGPYSIDEGDSLTLDASGSTAGPSATYEWDVDGDGDYDESITGQVATVSWAQLESLGVGDGPYTGDVSVRVSGSITGSGGSDPVSEVEPNNTIGAAQDIDGAGWNLNADPDIANATTIPHVTIEGTGDNTFDYYSFTATAGAQGTFDVDYGMNSGGSFDPYLHLFTASGSLLAANDDYSTSAGAGGSAHSFDSFLQYTFPTTGEYVIRVGRYPSGNPVPAGGTYELQVSLESHLTGSSGVDPVSEVEPNNTIGAAQDIDGAGWNLNADPDIANATTIPHITIEGTGDNTFDYYSFTATAGSQGIFDVDYGMNSGGSFDPYLHLFTASGSLLAANDDYSTSAGAGGSLHPYDSFLQYTFPTTGEYVIRVGRYPSGNPVPAGGTYELQVSLENHLLGGSGVDTDTTTLVIDNVAPAVQLDAVSPIDENGTATLTGSYTDPGVLDEHDVTVDWDDPNNATDSVFAVDAIADLSMNDTFTSGDGAVLTVTGLTTDTVSFSVEHQYLDDGVAPGNGLAADTSTISVTVVDDDTGIGSDTADVLVENVAPEITSLTTWAEDCGNAHEDSPITLDMMFDDDGTLDEHTVVIDWGDGNTETVVLSVGDRSLSIDHDYAVGGVYTVGVSLSDDDTGADADSRLAVVSGVGLHNGVLQVIGTAADDQVTINQTGNGTLKVHADFIPEHALDQTRDFALADIDRLFLLLCEGSDHATVSSRVMLDAIIDGGAGDDHLNGGDGANVILGRAGDDHINGGSGRDILVGGLGTDRVVGNAGRDLLSGGVLQNAATLATDSIADEADLLTLQSKLRDATDVQIDDWRDGVDDFFADVALDLVVDAGDADVLTGSSGDDWFAALDNDVANDIKGNGKGKA